MPNLLWFSEGHPFLTQGSCSSLLLQTKHVAAFKQTFFCRGQGLRLVRSFSIPPPILWPSHPLAVFWELP